MPSKGINTKKFSGNRQRRRKKRFAKQTALLQVEQGARPPRMELRDGPGVSKKRLRRMRIRKKNSKQWATSTLTDRDLAAIAMSKIEEAESKGMLLDSPEPAKPAAATTAEAGATAGAGAGAGAAAGGKRRSRRRKSKGGAKAASASTGDVAMDG